MSESLSPTVHAFKWTCDVSLEKAPAWLRAEKHAGHVQFGKINAPNFQLIVTRDQDYGACNAGDWIVRDGDGRLHCIPRETFEATYELAGQEPELVQDITDLLRDLVQFRSAGGLHLITVDMVVAEAATRREAVTNVYRRRVSALAA